MEPAVLAGRGARVFVVSWILYAVHFTTNVVREHYPAFTIAEHGTLFVDEYQGFHADIFVHSNGHSVIGNQVFVSVLAAVPLFIFDPVLDALEDYRRTTIARDGVRPEEYRIDKPLRRQFFELVKARGLDLRFGAATVVTSVFFMAPLTAAFLVLFQRVLRRRGLDADKATVLTFLLGFGTPLFFRTSTLNHNMFVMFGMFASFAILWRAPGVEPVSSRRLAVAGLLAGTTLATDYIGVIILPLLFAYVVLDRVRSTSPAVALRESLPFVAGTLPPIAFLLYSQWAMYGNPFLPGQAWMPDQNIYVGEGMRGFTLPELLVAMVITMTVLGAAATALQDASRASEAGEGRQGDRPCRGPRLVGVVAHLALPGFELSAARQADVDALQRRPGGGDRHLVSGAAVGDVHLALHGTGDGERQLAVGRAADDVAVGVVGPLLPAPGGLAAGELEARPHLDLARGGAGAADGERQARAAGLGRVVGAALDGLGLAALEADLAVAAPRADQRRNRTFGTGRGRRQGHGAGEGC